MVMDGLHHVNKLASLHRKKISTAAATELAHLFKSTDTSLLTKGRIAKLKKDSVVAFRSDIEAELVAIFKSLDIKFMRAPFEADPQLIELCKCGIADAIYSTDSDMVVIGYNADVMWICNKIDFYDKNDEVAVLDFSKEITKSKVVKALLGEQAVKEGVVIHRKLMHVIACIYGNDYVPPVAGETPTEKKAPVAPALISLARLELGKVFDAGVAQHVARIANSKLTYKAEMGFGGILASETYSKYFSRARVMFAHPPVFRFSKTAQEEDDNCTLFKLLFGPASIGDLNRREVTTTVTLVPLFPLPKKKNKPDWKSLLGFDPEKKILDFCQSQPNKSLYPYVFGELSRKLRTTMIRGVAMRVPYSLSEDRLVKPRTHDEKEASYESVLDFEAVALCHITNDALHKWLACRGIYPILDCSRIQLEKFIKNIQQQWKINKNDIYPLVQPASNFTLDNYLEMIQLTAGGALDWTNEGDKVIDYLHGDQEAEEEDDDYCAKPLTRKAIEDTAQAFISGPSSVHRVERLTEGGNADVTTMQIAFGQRGERSGGEEVVLVSCSVVSSMRTITQTVLLVFAKRTGEFQPPPVSRCTCEAGRFACSHMYCVLYIITGIQDVFDDWSMAEVAAALPPPVRLLSGKLLPMQYVYGEQPDVVDESA
jgi:hypothetical protein